MNVGKRLVVGAFLALSLTATGSAFQIGTGTAHAIPIDLDEVCGVYRQAPGIAEAYGLTRREATIQFVAGWYQISKAAAERALDAADC